MSNNGDLKIVRDQIVNSAIVIGFVFGVLSYLVTLIRSLTYGFDEAFVAITLVIIGFGFIAGYRKKLSLNFKIYTVMLVVLMALITGLSNFGFLVSSKAYIILIPVFVSFILDFKNALLSMLFYGSIYALFGYLYISGTVSFEIDANQYVLDIRAWLMDLSIILLTGFALLLVGKKYSEAILNNLAVIKTKNEDLNYEEKRYQNLFENSFDAILILKGEKIQHVNQRCLELFKCKQVDIVNRNILDLSSEIQPGGIMAKERAETIFKMLASGEPQFLEWEHINLKGEVFLASLSLVQIQYNHTTLYQAVVKDITKQKEQEKEINQYKEHLEKLVQQRTEELEYTNRELQQSNISLMDQRNKLEEALDVLHATQEKLIESDKMASIGVLTSGVAHELNNPLNYIQSGLYSLQNMSKGQYEDLSKDELDDLNDQVINGIEEGVKRISEIVLSLEQFNKKDTKDFSSCNIPAIIDACLNILAFETKARIKVIKYYPEKAAKVMGNVSELHQVFINILYNAIQAIRKKGKIEVCISHVDGVGNVRVDIKDSGEGIDYSIQHRIFEPFFTTKDVGGGSGLGLSTAYNIIKKHQGEIMVESKIKKGSTFSIILPAKREN